MNRLTIVCVAATLATAARAQSTAPDGPVATHHQIAIGGKTLKYTATAGRLPIINNEDGTPHGWMFYVAYTLDGASRKPARPVTFLWNGGPGSSASQVHLLGFGPRRIEMGGETYPTSKPLTSSTPLVDNQESWLEFTDLVFVDSIGTGYSRPTKPEYGSEFYNAVGDAESVAEFIRVYRERFDAFDAPIFLAGESYGTIRAMWVSEALERRRTHVTGIALISGYIRTGQHSLEVLDLAASVPLFTRTAWYHKKLAPDLQSLTQEQAVERADKWARAEYAPALERRESVTPLTQAERDSIVARLARYAGVKPALVDAKSLTLLESTFTDHLLEDQGLDLGRYDARMTAKRDVSKIPWTTIVDPSLSAVMDIMQGTSPTMLRYYRDELGYKSDLVYRGPFGGAFPAPATPDGDWMAAQWKGEGPAGVLAYEPSPEQALSGKTESIPLVPPLRRAMELNPGMHILVVNGEYDTATSCDNVAYKVQLIESPLRERVTIKCYLGGHMMYTDKLARRDLARDMAALVRGAK